MPRGRSWAQEEVSTLLELVKDTGESALLMASTSLPNEALWQQISEGLAAAGYERSAAQCRSKWKTLKSAFHSARETRRRASCHSPSLPPHYRAMKSIWKAAGRPVFGERRMLAQVKLPPSKRRSPLATGSPSSPDPPEHGVGEDAPDVLLSPLPQPESSASEDHVAGVPSSPPAMPPSKDHVAGVPSSSPAMPQTSCCFSLLPLLGEYCAQAAALVHPRAGGSYRSQAGSALLPGNRATLKQERAEQKPGFPDEASLGMGNGNEMFPVAATAQGTPGATAMSEQQAAGEETLDTSLHGLLQSVQQLLVQILQTSQQQQALLESLASDIVSNVHLLSHSLVKVGETLHQLLLRPQTHSSLLSHYFPHMPVFEGGSGVPFAPGTPHTSLDHKEDPHMSPAAGCTPS
ncbi:uncharacterized protein [Phaenicophaeus curvirostris]|uniref:uncharacterized protein isoform X2 n=1 Tax=Phaenicophaeus curvirostris TaxID=33595 RepID=UPI0037F0EF8B